MNRRLSLSCALVALADSGSAYGQSHITGAATGGIEHTSNAYSVPVDQEPIADQILSIRPMFEGVLETRGMSLTAAYRLDYHHYQTEAGLSRAFHTLDGSGALIWWDDVDLELTARLAAVPVSLAAPVSDPTNQFQQGALGGRVVYRREMSAATRVKAGYVGERVTWLEVHTSDRDRLPADYVSHGPAVGVERDISRTILAGLDYRYVMQVYDGEEEGLLRPPAENLAAHSVQARTRMDPTEWLAVQAAIGFQHVDYELSDPALRLLADVTVRAGGDVAATSVFYRENHTQDVYGQPATIRGAGVSGEYSPWAPWGVRLGASYGELVFGPDSPVTQIESHVLGEASFFYQVQLGQLEIAASRHQSLPISGEAPVVVDRASLRLGGRF